MSGNADPGRMVARRMAEQAGMDPDDESVLDAVAGTMAYQVAVLNRNAREALGLLAAPAARLGRFLSGRMARR